MSVRDSWCTPEKLWGVVVAYRPIDLDPCRNWHSTVPAARRVVSAGVGFAIGRITCGNPSGVGSFTRTS